MNELHNDQLEVLNRMAHMLDEYSVQFLASQDEGFQRFVETLHSSIDRQADAILS